MILGIEAITFDFGNTLVPFPAGPMATVLHVAATGLSELTGRPIEEVMKMWGEERSRQFAEDVPEGREADMDVRVARVLARLRGRIAPPASARWKAADVARWSTASEVEAMVGQYADAFVTAIPAPGHVGPMLERLASRYRLAIVSNWPLSLALDRFVENAGWKPYLAAVVVSQRVGAIKPRAAIFETAARQLGVLSGPAILHVGDDPGADVLGAQALGWRTVLVRLKPEDSSLPVAPPVVVVPDLEIDTVLDLEAALGLQPAPGTP
ncbi:MAG TPA: HAD family hydrolase [Candidatus Limnocylindrales bacterium]